VYTITESWDVLDAWLEQHAPVTLEKLGPPAKPATITLAEARIGQTVPEELVESLRCHDGGPDLLPVGSLLSVAQIVESYELWMENARDNDLLTGIVGGQQPWWDPQWIPFGDENGNTQIIDMRPGPTHRQLGMAYVYREGTFDDYVCWPSLPAYLAEVATALAAGQPVRDWKPYLFGTKRDLDANQGELTWSAGSKTKFGKRIMRPAPPRS
jgi:cell wall assembly regulator SMI1